jgi:hypothetical protein
VRTTPRARKSDQCLTFQVPYAGKICALGEFCQTAVLGVVDYWCIFAYSKTVRVLAPDCRSHEKFQLSLGLEIPQAHTEPDRCRSLLLEKVAELRPLIRAVGPSKAAAMTELVIVLLLSDLDEHDRKMVVGTLSAVWQTAFTI